MRGALFLGVASAVALHVTGCGSGLVPDDAGMDARAIDDADAPIAVDTTSNAIGLDAPGLDAPGLDAPGLDAPGLDAPGLDAPGLDAPGLDAPGLDAPGLDALSTDALGVDALARDANADVGSRFDRCSAGCAYVAACGLGDCTGFGIDCASADEAQSCLVDCLRGYACADVPTTGYSSCSSACRPPVDAALPDVFATDTRSDSGSLSDRCTAGCDYLLGCGFSTCASLGVDCSSPTANQACLADCLRGFACADVPGAGFTYCQRECASTVDAGPPYDGGPGPAACTACAMSSCESELAPCLADDTCSQLAFCTASCTDRLCRDDCSTRYPATASLRDPVFSCLCTRCVAPCSRIDPCAP